MSIRPRSKQPKMNIRKAHLTLQIRMYTQMKYFFFIFSLAILMATCKPTNEEPILADDYVSRDFASKMDCTFNLLNTNHFDQVQNIIIEMANNSKTPMERYLVNCYQAELFYFNDLADQGIKSTLLAKDIAVKLNKPELIANCDNFLGLFNLLSRKNDTALTYFKLALKKLPPLIKDPNLVRHDQILNNLAESFLNKGAYDSAVVYAEKSMNFLSGLKKNRTLAISFWTKAEALLGLGDVKQAEENYTTSLNLGISYNEGDVMHYNFSGLIKTNLAQQKPEQVLKYIDLGTDSLLLENTSKIAVTEFYETAIMALNKLNKPKQAIDLMYDFYLLNKQQRDRELYHQTTILNRYFDNNRDLILSNAANSIKEKEIEFSKKMIVVLAFFFVTFIIGAYFLFQNRKNTERLRQIEVENEILKLKKDNEIKAILAKAEAIDQERNRLARELHDDIGSSMSSVRIYADVAINELEKNPEKAKKVIQKQSSEIAQISENISDLIWAIYSKNEKFSNLFERMREFAFNINSAKDIQFEFDIDPNLNDYLLTADSRKNMLLIFKEFVNNSLKYAQATQLKITIKEANNQIHYCLHDNGIGFNAHDVKRGNGLYSFEKRAEDLKANIKYESVIGHGTSLNLIFDLSAVIEQE